MGADALDSLVLVNKGRPRAGPLSGFQARRSRIQKAVSLNGFKRPLHAT